MKGTKTEVIVVAAGAGKRLKTKMPKALTLLNGRPLFLYCLRVFNKHPAIDGIVLVGVKKHLRIFDRLAFSFKKVRAVVAGGTTRAESVRCGLKEVSPDCGVVLVHDAARPFVDNAIIDRLLSALKTNQAAIAGVPVKFTVKKVDPKTLYVSETPPRDLLWEAQTPQGFHRKVLDRAHAVNFKEEATDDAMLVEGMGCKVKMVMGSYHNIKITVPEDVGLARQLLDEK